MLRRSVYSRHEANPRGRRGLRLPGLIFSVHLAWAVSGAPRLLHADDLLPQLNSGGHSSKINDLKVSADGRFVLSVGQDKVAYIWDLEHADRLPKSLRGQSGDGPQGFLHSVAISPVGNLVAVGGWTRPRIDGTCDPCEIRLYDIATGETIALLRGHRAPVQALVFSRDGRWLLSGDDAGHAFYWNVEGAPAARARGHSRPHRGSGFSSRWAEGDHRHGGRDSSGERPRCPNATITIPSTFL